MQQPAGRGCSATAQRRQQLGGGSAVAALAVAAARQCNGGGSLAAAAAAVAARWRRTVRRWQAMDGARARAMAIDGAGQEGGTTRGRREAMRQPAGRGCSATARRRRQLGGGAAAAAAAAAAARQCNSGGSLVAAAVAVAARRRCTARQRQAMDRARARAMAIDGAGQEGGTTRGQREAMKQPAGQEVPNHFDR